MPESMPRRTRRAMIGAVVAGSALAVTPVAAAAPPAAHVARLGAAVRRLNEQAGELDYSDGPACAAYYAEGEQVVAAVSRLRARDWAALQVKAEAVAWACASRSDFALGDSASEQLVATILRDLLEG